MKRFAELLALRCPSVRTRHSYYRDMRLIHEFCQCDPKHISEQQLRDYFLFVKTVKKWKPKTIRQTVASAKIFFVQLIEHEDWKIFSQIKTKDLEELPNILSREEICQLFRHIRLRRYRVPLKLIYCCGLRLAECLSLTIHDIQGDQNKLWVRHGKGGKDRLVPIATPMVEDLRAYWKVHRNPLLLFPNVGRGHSTPETVARRMHEATAPMPYSSLQRLMLKARKELNFEKISVHTLRHSYATHLAEGGATPHTIQILLGHAQITTTIKYLHLTHHSEQHSLQLAEELCRGLPR